MTTTDYAALRDAVKAHAESIGLKMAARFVPQSQSRNRDEKDERGKLRPTLNWSLTFNRGRGSLAVDYSQGIGHVPGYSQRFYARSLTMDDAAQRDSIEQAAELGTYPASANRTRPDWMPQRRKPLPPPDMADVLQSLVLDAEVIDAGGFEEWARNYGYDTDSRKAEAIYQACIEQSLKLRALIGDDNIAKVRELTAEL